MSPSVRQLAEMQNRLSELADEGAVGLLSKADVALISWALGYASGGVEQGIPSPRRDRPAGDPDLTHRLPERGVPTPGASATMTREETNALRLELLLAMLLQQMPALELGQLVEGIAILPPSDIPGRQDFYTWHHPGLAQFVRDLRLHVQPPEPLVEVAS